MSCAWIVEPNLFAHNKNHATSCHVLSHMLQTLMMSCAHFMTHAHQQACHPQVLTTCYKIFICLTFEQAKGLLLKLPTAHFNTYVMKQILITM